LVEIGCITGYNRSVTSNPAPQGQNQLSTALIAAQARWQLFPPPAEAPTAVLVAVSGGVDSICLLHALHKLADQWHLQLHVGHVDHRLRPSSAVDAHFVAELAAAYGLPFHHTMLEPELLHGAAGGLEAAARRARYEALCRMAAAMTPTGQAPHVAVAHHADDQAETILMHLIQGGSLRGLAGMRPVSELPLRRAEAGRAACTARLVRPLLAVRRSALEDYVRAHGLAWREDSTNQEMQFLRNRLRRRILPELEAINPKLVATLVRSAGLVAEEADRLDALDQATLASLLAGEADGTRVVIDLAGFQALAPAAQRGLLRRALLNLDADLRDFGFERIEELAAVAGAQAHRGGPYPLPGGLAWTIAGDAAGRACLSLHRQPALPLHPNHPFLDVAWRNAPGVLPLPARGTLEVGGWTLDVQPMLPMQLPAGWRTNPDRWLAYLDADAAGTPALTTPFPGATFAPLGMGGSHKHLGDLFTDHKVPVALRAGWPLIVDPARRQVLWVCGLQMSHTAAVTEATQRVVCLAWRR
jgi:tRNA(Ile)-lysidine synthase